MKIGPDPRDATFNGVDVEFGGLAEGLTLRPHDVDWGYNPNAALPVSATVTFPAMSMPGLRELWGFEEVADYPCDASGARLGAIGWRASTAGGAAGSFYWWNGAAWAVASGTDDWCSADAMSGHLHELAISPTRSIVLVAQISSDPAHAATPRLRQPWMLAEVAHRGVADVEESLQAFLVASGTPELARAQKMAATGTALSVRSSWEPLEVLAAYDLATDPNRTTSIFASAGAPTKTDAGWVVPVTLSAPRAADVLIETRYRGRCPVAIGLADEELFDAEVPSVGVLEPSVEERVDLSPPGEIEINLSRRMARERPAPMVKELTFNIFVQVKAGAEEDAAALCEALHKSLTTKPLLFLPTGERLPVFPLGPFENEDIAARGVLVRRAAVRVLFHDWPSEFEVVPLVDEVRGVFDGAVRGAGEAFSL